jgi:DnaK suppressor protein
MVPQASQNPLPPDEYLTPEELAELHATLRRQLDEVLHQGSAAVSTLTREDEAAPDPLDLAANTSDREIVQRQADRERHLLHKVRGALQRIAEGEYGSCETCGGAIGFQRLRARPVATQCIDCKTEAERLETRRASADDE